MGDAVVEVNAEREVEEEFWPEARTIYVTMHFDSGWAGRTPTTKAHRDINSLCLAFVSTRDEKPFLSRLFPLYSMRVLHVCPLKGTAGERSELVAVVELEVRRYCSVSK